jgi:hypothetical protein
LDALAAYTLRLDALRAERGRRMVALEDARPAPLRCDYLGLRVDWASVARAIAHERRVAEEHERNLSAVDDWYDAQRDALRKDLGL